MLLHPHRLRHLPAAGHHRPVAGWPSADAVRRWPLLARWSQRRDLQLRRTGRRSRTRELFCARDQFAIKPFYYSVDAGPGADDSFQGTSAGAGGPIPVPVTAFRRSVIDAPRRFYVGALIGSVAIGADHIPPVPRAAGKPGPAPGHALAVRGGRVRRRCGGQA